MSRPTFVEIAGILLAIAALGAGFIIYGMQKCDSTESSLKDIKSSIGIAEKRLSSANNKLVDIQSSIKFSEQLTDWNNEYLSDVQKYEQAKKDLKAISDVMDLMEDNKEGNSDNGSRLEEALAYFGINPNIPIPSINFISNSPVAQNDKAKEILYSKEKRALFRSSLIDWMAGTDKKAAKFFSRVSSIYGEKAPKAGEELGNIIIGRKSKKEADLKVVTDEISEQKNQLKTLKVKELQFSLPCYCAFI